MTARAPGRWLAALALLLLTAWFSFGAAQPAQAAVDDVFDQFDVVANVTTDGYVEVTETITLRFGASSGRHGLERTLWTREPDGEDHDVVYRIDRVRVSSPSGVSTQLDLSDQGSGRNTYLRIRVGDPDVRIRDDTATYVLSYRVAGLLRTSGSYDELYWDLTGSSMPPIASATARITVPGGAQDVFCSVAMPGGRGDCDRAVVGDAEVAEFAAEDIPTGQVVTVSVQLVPGLVSNNKPIRVENADAENARAAAWAFGGSAAAAAVVPFLGWWYTRRRATDLRFEGLPPGVLPARGQTAREVRDRPKPEIPVSFAPPKLSVAEAGLLADGEIQVRDTTAALVSLAVAGAVQLRSDDRQQVRLVDPSRAPDPVSQKLLDSLFRRGSQPGDVVDLGEPGTLTKGHQRVERTTLSRAEAGGWFTRTPGAKLGAGFALGGLFFPMVTFGIVGTSFLGPILPFALPLLLAIVITWIVVRSKLRRGQRSGVGRALTDQVEGFRTYLATAEAEQLRFEEGEDIFSKYLPWAIMFDLTDRWTQVCQRLVELGRLPAVAPAWYYGSTWDLHLLNWQLASLSSSVGSSIAAPAPDVSDTGFGSGGSAFGGGGFSGGGGGGGGGGSW